MYSYLLKQSLAVEKLQSSASLILKNITAKEHITASTALNKNISDGFMEQTFEQLIG